MTEHITDLGIATAMATFFCWPLEELIARGQLDVSRPGEMEIHLTRLDTGEVIVIKGTHAKRG